jgi:hypothetical protein
LADDWSLVLELLAVECDVLLFVVAVAVDFVVLSFESLFPELQAAKTNHCCRLPYLTQRQISAVAQP